MFCQKNRSTAEPMKGRENSELEIACRVYKEHASVFSFKWLELEEKMESNIKKFVTSGFFAIRRSGKYWSGIRSDQTIRKYQMRLMKTSGGFTS